MFPSCPIYDILRGILFADETFRDA
jgi:hypothetical protein